MPPRPSAALSPRPSVAGTARLWRPLVVAASLLLGSVSLPLATPGSVAAQTGRLDLLGQYGGAVMAVAAERGLVLVGMGPRVLVMTGCDPLYLEELGRTEVLRGVKRIQSPWRQTPSKVSK